MSQKTMPLGIGKSSGIRIRTETNKSAKKKNGKTMLNGKFLLMPRLHETNICQ